MAHHRHSGEEPSRTKGGVSLPNHCNESMIFQGRNERRHEIFEKGCEKRDERGETRWKRRTKVLVRGREARPSTTAGRGKTGRAISH